MSDLEKEVLESVDILVGGRIRFYRIINGISQGELARAIGLTFQQVQKYEKGVNRIAPSRLVRVAKILKVQAHDFFPTEDDLRSFEEHGEMYFSQYARAGMDLAACFMTIEDTAVRTNFKRLVIEMAASFDHMRKVDP